jgi:hypothetical protein
MQRIRGAGVKRNWCLTSSDTGPDDGVASLMPFEGVPLLHSLNFSRSARSGARGVRRLGSTELANQLRAHLSSIANVPGIGNIIVRRDSL